MNVQGATIGYPGTVAYSAATPSLVVGDHDTYSEPTFYHVNGQNNVPGPTILTCSSGDCVIVQATVRGKTLVGPDATSISAAIFPWPAGGAASKTLSGAAFEQPIGSAEVKS